MSIITSQNWDSVAAGSIPSGWTLSSGLTLLAGTFQSSPNALAATGIQGAGTFYATYATADGNGGNAASSADFCANGLTNQKWGLFGRSSQSPPNLSTAVYYELRLEYFTGQGLWGLSLYEVDHGAMNVLSSRTITSFAAAVWYTATLSMVGSTLTGALQRKSDGYWLNASGSWQSAPAAAISVVNSDRLAAGYWGLTLSSTSSGAAYSDNFSLATAEAPIVATSLAGSAALAFATVVSAAFATIVAAPCSATGAQGTAIVLTSAANPAAPIFDVAGLSEALAYLSIDAQPSVVAMAGTLPIPSELTSAVLSGFRVDAAGTLANALVGGSAFVSVSAADGSGQWGTASTVFGSTIAAGSWNGSGLLPSIVSVDRSWTLSVDPIGVSAVLPMVSLQSEGSQYVGIAPVVAGWPSFGIPSIWLHVASGIVYNVYANNGDGGPIDYDAPVATTSALIWTSPPLTAPGDWKFGVRALRLDDGLEEKNLDAAVSLVLDASGVDVSRRPPAPTGLRAIARPAGVVRVEWGYHVSDRPRTPLGFRVYAALGDVLDTGVPLATVPYVQGRTSYLADLSGLTPGLRHVVGVRAFNASGEEPNAVAVAIVPDATGPGGVDSLLAAATDTEGV